MTLGGLLGFCLSIFSTVEHCYHNNKEDERKKKKISPLEHPRKVKRAVSFSENLK